MNNRRQGALIVLSVDDTSGAAVEFEDPSNMVTD